MKFLRQHKRSAVSIALVIIIGLFCFGYTITERKDIKALTGNSVLDLPQFTSIGIIPTDTYPTDKESALKYALTQFQAVTNSDIWEDSGFWLVAEPYCKGGCKRLRINQTTGEVILERMQHR